jgi:putative peptidoglycan lipid II flippase
MLTVAGFHGASGFSRTRTVPSTSITTTRIVSPVFYALGKSRVPVAMSAVSVGVNLVLSLLLVRTLGFVGLALATSMAALANATLCMFLLGTHLGGIGGQRLAAALAKVALASLGMSAGGRREPIAVRVRVRRQRGFTGGRISGFTIGAGLVALAIAGRLLRIDEFAALGVQVRRRVRMLLAR